MSTKLIIDTDPGIDDAMAIHYAFAHKNIEVMALTTIFGNVTTKQATINSNILVQMAGIDCGVFQGCEFPEEIKPNPPADFVHGTSGFGDLEFDNSFTTQRGVTAPELIVQKVNEFPEEITICALGPLTNLSKALALDPSIAKKVKEIVIMGGAVFVPGNVTRFAEANIFNDPHAAARVLSGAWKTRLIGLDVTKQIEAGIADFLEIKTSAPKIGDFLSKIADFYIEFYRKEAKIDGCFLHDPATVIAITNPAFFKFRRIKLGVVLKGEMIGKTFLEEDGVGLALDVAVKVASQDVVSEFKTVLSKSDQVRYDRISAV